MGTRPDGDERKGMAHRKEQGPFLEMITPTALAFRGSGTQKLLAVPWILRHLHEVQLSLAEGRAELNDSVTRCT
jgi:hypothetical protein